MTGGKPDGDSGTGPAGAGVPPRHHLMIAGTGRAGTSFLVRFLAAMGLDTHLARSGDEQWDDAANAGFEDIPIPDASSCLPYVVKTPMLTELIDDVLGNPAIHVDAVIIPIRDLVEAAASRTVLEQQALHQPHPWMAGLGCMVETWGITPGGTLFSLNPIDQGRLLAVGLHRLIERLTKADVPIVFLDFPRLIEDPAYLFAKLRILLPADATLEQALSAHAQFADPNKVRIGRELLVASRATAASETYQGPTYPDLHALEAIAVRRELRQLRAAASGQVDPGHGRERQLGQRELAMGQREIAMAQREAELSARANELDRQAETLAMQGQELDKKMADLAAQKVKDESWLRPAWLRRLIRGRAG